MPKQKICIIPPWYPSKNSPASGIFFYDQAIALSSIYDVIVFVPEIISLHQVFSKWFITKNGLVNEHGIDVYRQKILTIPLLFKYAPKMYITRISNRSVKAFANLQKKWGVPSLIHAHVLIPSAAIAVAIKQKTKIPVIYTEHYSRFESFFNNSKTSALSNIILKNVDIKSAVSPSLIDRMKSKAPELTLQLFPNIIPDYNFVKNDYSKISNTSPIIFFTAALWTPLKGFEYLLSAVEMLVNEGTTNFRLKIGGRGTKKIGFNLESFKEMVNEKNLKEYCEFVGFLSREKMIETMQSCDVFINPSLTETFSVVLGEANMCGKPVIATKCGGPEYVVTNDTGVLVEPKNSKEMADAMLGFINKKYTYNSDVVKNSIVARFGTEEFLKRAKSLYDNISKI